MRVVFMGTPEFAVPSLHALVARHVVVGVYTRPDSVSGRGGALRPSPVKQAALDLDLPVYQPGSLREPAEVATLTDIAPDVIVVAAYGMILPREVLDIPRFGCINVHASLLPRWRGAAPIQRAILAGDEIAGVSIMRMEVGLDTGPFCKTAETPIGDKTTQDLVNELANLGAAALIDALESVESEKCEWIEQNEAEVTYADKITKADVALSPDLSVDQALARVRASSPQAPSKMEIDGRRATILRASRGTAQVAPGDASCTKHAVILGFADGSIEVDAVKPDGKGTMIACDWARGARFNERSSWQADR